MRQIAVRRPFVAMASGLSAGSLSSACLVAVFLAGVAAPAGAQDNGAAVSGDLPPVADLVAPMEPFRLKLGYEWQDDGGLLTGGRVGIQRANADLGYDKMLDGIGQLSFDLSYNLSAYDFTSDTGFAEVWDDVHQVSLTATLEVELDNEWTVFGGPILRYAGETGASFSDSVSGGGFAGLAWSPDENLQVGLGFAVFSQIEDDVEILPIIVLDWQFTEGVSLRTLPTSFLTEATEFQLVVDVDRDFELAAGVLIDSRRRYRLDDEGILPDAVGQEEGTWIYLRGNWNLGPSTELTATVGLGISPDLILNTSGGDPITKIGYDEVITLGAELSFRF